MKHIFKEILHKKFSFQDVFFIIIGISAVRVLAEWALFAFPIQLNGFQDYVRFYLENTYYFLVLFIVGSLIVSWLSKIALEKVINFGIKIYPVIILPPLIDALFFGRTQGYNYGTVQNLLLNFITLSFATPDASIGISIEILLALIIIFIYVFRMTKNILRAFLSILFIDIFIYLLSTPDLLFGSGKGDYYYGYFLPLYYFFPFVAILCAVLWACSRSKFKAILGNLRMIRSMAYVLAVYLGGMFQYSMGIAINISSLFCAMFSAFFVWQLSVVINDICDISIDSVSNKSRPLIKGSLTISEYKLVAIIFIFLSLSFAVVTSGKIFALVLFMILLAYIYSVPPLRLRNNLYGNMLIGVSLAVSFLIGCYSSDAPFLSPKCVFLTMLIFLFGSALSMAKDIKDIEGDGPEGVVNLFTTHGYRKGKKIVAAIIFVVLNVATFACFNIFAFIISIVAVWAYYKFESIKAVYILGIVNILITAGVFIVYG